nr:membrane-spanning 4-domains subfamily A member 18-like isoform X1 [Equus asinus]XP_044606246.1 membrane-spanning 4-domains subfamily A member 18-like isoform X1 [Equus asinus]XP_044606247.1 membrane-spanning 4-domains subfamily A member 18-like isoform X1 [Equus asinus]
MLRRWNFSLTLQVPFWLLLTSYAGTYSSPRLPKTSTYYLLSPRSSPQGKMPQSLNHVWIKKEARMLGAIQIASGVINLFLGMIWARLLVSQLDTFGKTYIPIAGVSAYGVWSSFFFVIAGFCTMMLEKTRERCWMTHTIFTNVLSSCIALIGLLLISLELAIFSSSKKRVIWPQKCGKLLSEYLWLFTSLQFLVSCVVMHWILKAKYRR